MHKYKMDFNRKVIALRDKKINIIEKIKKYLNELTDLQENISEEKRKQLPVCPTLQPSEIPERWELKYKESVAYRHFSSNYCLCSV